MASPSYLGGVDIPCAFATLDTMSIPTETENTEHLTRREHEVMACLLKAMSDKQIAGELVCDHKTVRAHLYHIYRKLGVKNRVEAIVYYLDNFIIH